jgi:hypothetical protein
MKKYFAKGGEIGVGGAWREYGGLKLVNRGVNR